MKVAFFTLDLKHLGDVSLLVSLICTPLISLLTVAFFPQRGFLTPYLNPRIGEKFFSLSYWLLAYVAWLGLCGLFQKEQNKWKSIVSLVLCLLCFAFYLLLCLFSI